MTYPPHAPGSSSDKLWTVDTNFALVARPESVGGTHANRMLHRESQQLIIGPYVIDTNGVVRVIPRDSMPGRLWVVTERRLFQAHGTFYELPLSDSGGFRRVRPVTTHNRHISDFASWRGLLTIAGVAPTATNKEHVFRSDDGRAALWFGNVDDLWRMGPPAGVGGPWNRTAVSPGVPSDPYLIYGYERKELQLSHRALQPVTFTVEVDFCADNTWSEYRRFTVAPSETCKYFFPDGYSAHWVRLQTDTAAEATATFTYGGPLVNGPYPPRPL